MSAFLSLRAKFVFGGASFIGIALLDYCTSLYVHRQCFGNVDGTIASGTCPNLKSSLACGVCITY